MTAYFVKVNLVSLKTTDTKNTAVVQIVNKSATPLTAQHEVTVGIYEDIFGEKLLQGATALKTFPYSELYKNDGGVQVAQILSTAFDIPTVTKTTSVYAIAKVRKTIQSGLRAAGDGEDVEQAEKNYASIQLFPVANVDNTPTGLIEKPQTPEADNTGIKISGIPGYAKIEIANRQDNKMELLRIYDVSGRLVCEKTILQSVTLIPLKSGVYVVTVGGKTEKIIIL